MTAIGGRGAGRLDYLTSGEGQTGASALPRIGSQNVNSFQGVNAGKYQTINSQKNILKGPVIRQAE